MTLLKNIGKYFILVLALIVGLYSLRYLPLQPIDLLSTKGALLESYGYKAGFFTHVLFGAIALIIGMPQFFPKLRNRYLNLHRKLGKLYVLSCMLAGLAGFGIAWFANEGWYARVGFMGLAIAWLYTTYQAYRQIRQKQVEKHYQWMIRSYAVTLAAVTLRFWIPVFLVSGFSFSTAYPIIAWLCWVPNILAAEWLVYQRKKHIEVPA